MNPGTDVVGLPTPGPDETFHGDPRLLPDKVRALYAQIGVSLFGNLLGALVLVAIFLDVAPRTAVLGWALVFGLIWIARFLLRGRYDSRPAADRAAQAGRWLRLWNAGALASGAAWGLAPWLLYAHGGPMERAALIVTIFSYAVGSITLLAPQFRIFVAFICLELLPLILRIASLPEERSLMLAGVMGLAFLMTATLGRVYRATFERTIALKVRTEELATQLQAEKGVAEAARREAETASRAKTQFFAAASHDLRQPLHAMGLFAEALRARTRGDEEVLRLVHSINSSVEALEALFSELLDLTKIDTGAVEAVPEHFTLGSLFARLRLQYEPTAFEKGLSLRFLGERHAVFADPVLVDRIVRNLLANAIRYTVAGGVRITARRRGPRVLIQVWDSGVGIRPAEQERIFDEFYQAPGAPPLAEQERKGLGLGLAIVRRLAQLIEAPLGLRSRPGCGSVFSLSLPAGRPPRERPPAPRPPAALGLSLNRRRIVVVEDEPAVRDGLVVLLQGWGASVEAFENVGTALAWAGVAARSGAAAPDLLILDHRLPDGTGLEALEGLRQRFGDAALPALLVTGSTLSGHEQLAERHRYHLLTKPVAPSRLRAMIAFKLGRSPAADSGAG